MNNSFIVSTCPNISLRDWAFWNCSRDSTMAFKGACDSSLWNQDCPWSVSSFLSVIFHFPRPCFPYPCTWLQHLITGQLHHGSPVASCQMIWICFKVVSLYSLGLLISVQASQIAWLYHTVSLWGSGNLYLPLLHVFIWWSSITANHSLISVYPRKCLVESARVSIGPGFSKADSTKTQATWAIF